ncbi:hypothetical protein SUGI_0388870 [Cryptomeria japonica]|nr:hypothetical protein SUGI_0388870 [Cryptomeria japonica]
MRNLSLTSDSPRELYLPQNITALLDLHTLDLNKFGVTNWVCKLTNLRKLTSWGCNCKNYPALETLPNLVNLYLGFNESCTEVPKSFGNSCGFPKLRFLGIYNLPLLEELPDMEDGAMAALERFSVYWHVRE